MPSQDDVAQTMTPGDLFARWRHDPSKQTVVRNNYYDADLGAATERFFASEEFEALCWWARRYQRGTRLLDIGGGNGVAASAWARAGYAVTLVEVDRSDVVGLGALAGWHERPWVALVEADGQRLPLADQRFDVVYSRQVLHHIPDLHALSREVYRVLRPGGVWLATREHILSHPDDLQPFLDRHALHRYTGGEHAYVQEGYLHPMRAAGLRIVHTLGSYDSPINYYPATRGAMRGQVVETLQARWPMRRAWRYLAQFAWVRGWVLRYASLQDQRPGRMHTFIAMRPGG